MAIAAASSLSLGPVHYHLSQVEGVASSWMKTAFDGCKAPDFSGISFKSRNKIFGSTQFHWLSIGSELSPSKVSVAADYSDSVPDSSNYISNQGYHPLEELKVRKRIRETKLSMSEIARTTVEANSTALLVFPGTVHAEPHEQISWAEFPYVIDDYGDIFFEIFDDENIIQDRGASNPVNALIGMDFSMYENKEVVDGFNISDMGNGGIPFDDDYFEVLDTEASDASVDWGMPETSKLVHPVYFAKCLTKAVDMEYDKKMDHPSNGVSIIGCLRPAFADEALYLRRLFHFEESDGYASDSKEDEFLSLRSKMDGSKCSSTLYRLEIIKMELFSVYGVQSSISLEDYQDAEPDVLVHCTSAILEHFNEKEIRCNVALKALCKKKGIQVEGARLIGVDSLGMDVRVFSGLEVRTHRFPFKVQAMSETAAKKQIRQLLFPRSRRKKFRTYSDGLRDTSSF
ncbi:hypothetical protein SLE2022_143640 [Rubroshorea leprosula]